VLSRFSRSALTYNNYSGERRPGMPVTRLVSKKAAPARRGNAGGLRGLDAYDGGAVIESASAADVAWLAGLYEGEGCLAACKPRGAPLDQARSWVLSITMNDEDIVRRAHGVAGLGQVRPSRQPGNPWRWNVCARDEVVVVVRQLRPYLGSRRTARVEQFLAWYAAKGPSPFVRPSR
jgi:hypothetical protein